MRKTTDKPKVEAQSKVKMQPISQSNKNKFFILWIFINAVQGIASASATTSAVDNDIERSQQQQQQNHHQSYISVEKIQQQNLKLLEESLPLGWPAFCEAMVDEGVMSLYSGINPSDATLHVMTLTNQSVELPIKLLSEIRDFDINPHRKTLLFVNGYYTHDSYFSVLAHLKMLQTSRRDLNVIIVNFAKDLQQLYYAVRHHLMVQGYFVAKILAVLIANGIAAKDITLAGHSVGANIAALGATLYAAQTNSTQMPNGIQMGQLIAIDPARMCQASDVYVHRNVSERVIVIHGESEVFGVRGPLGTLDIYPNGIGSVSRRKSQPGCDTPLCSHMYSFVLFMEALIEGVAIPAVKCQSWSHFRKLACDYENVVAIGLKYPEHASGAYFCITQASPPFTFMEHGLKYARKVA